MSKKVESKNTSAWRSDESMYDLNLRARNRAGADVEKHEPSHREAFLGEAPDVTS